MFLSQPIYFFTTSIQAQFAIIKDKDGSTNVRASASKQGKPLATLKNGTIAYILEKEGNWLSVDFYLSGKQYSGYVYADRVMEVTTYKKISTANKDENIAELSRDSIKVVAKGMRFNKKLHKFSYRKDEPSILQYIDGKAFWGTDGGMPRTQYSTINITIGTRKISLPLTALHNLYEPNLYNTEAYYDAENDILYIIASNSDAAGSYDVIWKIEKGKYVGRIVEVGLC